MLEKMCKTCTAWFFAIATHIKQDGYRHNRIRIILVEDNIQPVGKGVFFVIDGKGSSAVFALADRARAALAPTHDEQERKQQ